MTEPLQDDDKAERHRVLSGPTYRSPLPDGGRMYVTINHDADGQAFEVFVRLDEPSLFEWVSALTVLITRLLRAGQSLDDIADELLEIYSPLGGHFLPGGKGHCPSLVAQIGTVLKEHCERMRSGQRLDADQAHS